MTLIQSVLGIYWQLIDPAIVPSVNWNAAGRAFVRLLVRLGLNM